uniref:Ras-related GTP-binding protein C n=1 Tax=Globodera pallida TaxID=36090 RepID=A0A183C7B7_GLOPA
MSDGRAAYYRHEEEDYDYGLKEDESDSECSIGDRPTIVIMGLKRSAISDSFINFETIEFPGQVDPFEASFDPNSIFSRCGALLFVIDAQADYDEALKKMVPAIVHSYNINKNIKFELTVSARKPRWKRTGKYSKRIYDHSIFEAFSKVIQKLIRQLSALEGLLDIFNQGSNIEKSFLFDVSSKIYIATDPSPVDMATYELCCDMIDVTIDVSSIYGHRNEQKNVRPAGFDQDSSAVITLRTRQINVYLALVCVIKEDNFEKQGLIDFNFNVFKQANFSV